VHPPYSLIGVQAAFTLGGDMRRRELLHFAIMRNACPDLAKMPFANEGWSEAVTSSLPDAHEFQGPPVCYDGSELQPEQWKPQRLLDNLDVARELLLDETSSPIHDIVDRGAVERVLADPERATPATCRQLFGALTAAVWLGGYEARQRIGDKPKPVDHQRPPPPIHEASARSPRGVRRTLRLGRRA
jgi:hypothetical protein